MIFETHARLDEAIKAVAPIVSTALKGTQVTITYDKTATAQQQADGNAIALSFDFSDAATAAWIKAKQADVFAVKDQVVADVAAIADFAANAKPTLEDLAAEVLAINERQQRMIKALDQLTQKLG